MRTPTKPEQRSASVSSISALFSHGYRQVRVLAEHEKTQAYPKAIETAHADFAAFSSVTAAPSSYSALHAT